MRPCVPHRRMCTTLGRFPTMATSIARGASISRKCNPRCPEHQVFQDLQLPCPKHVGATAAIFVAAQPPEPLPERTTDGGCCYYHFKTSFKPDGSVGAGGGSADPARTSTEGAAPTTPPGGVIDRMRQLEHSRVSRAALRAGPAMVARKCGPAGPYQLGPTTSHLGPCCRRTSRDPADKPDVLY